jgi:hypothetical protein
MSLVRSKKGYCLSGVDNKKLLMLWKRCWYDDWSVEYECSENGKRLTEKGDTVLSPVCQFWFVWKLWR